MAVHSSSGITLLRILLAAAVCVTCVAFTIFVLRCAGASYFHKSLRGAGVRVELLSKFEFASLRVEYSRTLAEHSPLLALPGVDPDRLENSIFELERAAEGLSSLQSEEGAAQSVRSTLYPLGFLRAMATLERARTDFISFGDEEHMRVYLEARKRAVRAYKRDLNRFEESFDTYVAQNDDKLVLAGQLMSSNDMKKTLGRMRDGIENTQRILIAESLCLHGFTFECDESRLSTRLSIGREPEAVNTSQVRSTRALVAEIFRQPEIGEKSFIALSDVACIEDGYTAPTFIIYDENMPAGMPSAERISMVSDMRFLLSERLTGVAFYKRLFEKGILYVLASPFLHYSCMQLGEDAGRAFVVNAVREFATSHPFDTIESPYADEISALESSLAKEIVHARDAEKYVLLGKTIEREAVTPDSVRKTLSDIALGMTYKTYGTEDLLLILAKTEQLDAAARKSGVAADLSASNLFFTRSGMQITFLTHNPSVAGDGLFTLSTAHVPETKTPYIYLSDFDLTAPVRAKIIEDSRDFVELLGHSFP